MLKSVNIDGEDYIIRSCEECPFYAEALGDNYCNYPANPRQFKWVRYEQEMDDNCPLGLVKECFSCKHDGQQQAKGVRCEGCTVCFHADTGIEDPPTKWEAKE